MSNRTSESVVLTADLDSKCAFVKDARRYASVVFPHPGGPHKIIEGRNPEESIFRMMPFFPTTCS